MNRAPRAPDVANAEATDDPPPATPPRDSDEPLTRCTFCIASNTKTCVTAAMLRLAEQRRLSLDDPLGNHLADEERTLLANDGYDLGAITLRHVLGHESGLDEHAGDPRRSHDEGQATRETSGPPRPAWKPPRG